MNTLVPMSKEDAERLAIPADERRDYVRLENAKSNMSRAAEDATWFRLVSVKLGNTTLEYPDGDTVQTMAPWEPPTTFDAVTWDHIAEILRRIEEGPEPRERWVFGRQSKDAWVGKVICEVTERGPAAAQRIIKAWVESGLLIKTSYPSPRRNFNSTDCVGVDPDKAAEMRAAARNSATSSTPGA